MDQQEVGSKLKPVGGWVLGLE